ncbi:aminotransferase class III-fold pyridoxal phosphate-dependent enzyme [Bacteriovorax sp. DB6_IX]|uniref:aminotransferase class III-fold pyridoxal phosphate-dependent enzyme n=1 Tax=Bacteriovorax sp. DB6_IX TaxID=1353530 RepID=UPI00038A4BCB|nr:aminotransferase class III-fold pyridoxal phosphate-dependent enzyme [Bacteriovorax sp. DB6_IX]EQC43151.1 aminotransferase, class III [Bacteriovorax sp. DB6_IX]
MYKKYVKPTQAKLLELLKLDREFVKGDGNYIYDSRGEQYLDVTGSYGANSLGHNNKLREKAAQYLVNNSLSFTQGSIRTEAANLACEFNKRLEFEGHGENWICQFSNTGTESIEIAIKVAKKNYHLNLKKELLSVNEALNKATRYFQRTTNNEALIKINELRKRNERKAQKTPFIMAMDNCFHGKTSGALKLTYNGKLKEDILSLDENRETVFIKRNDKIDLTYKIETLRDYFEIPYIENAELKVEKQNFYPICAFIAEPILGEAGVYELTKDFLEELQAQSKRIKSLLIFDEIQSGIYRTGTLASATHSGVTPDIFTFAKGLSAGFTKIGVTLIKEQSFVEDFDYIQSSTFAEDDLSSYIAREVLKEAENCFEHNGQAIMELRASLEEVVLDYPEVFKEVRGQGLMLAIEFRQELKNKFYEFKYFSDGGLLGHLFSSAMLNKENIRIAPTLSNQYTFRIQPSLNIKSWEILKIVTSLRNLADAIISSQAKYFFSHILGEIPVGKLGCIEKKIAKQIDQDFKAPAVFLNHPISNSDVRKILPVLEFTPDEILEEIMMATFNLQTFSPYYATNIRGENGNDIDIVMLSLPITSKILMKKFRGRQRHKVAAKIQEGIDKAKELGASTVGLGQFTSIVSKNGMYLNNKGLNLTTGNSFTAKLAYEAGIQAAADESSQVIGLVGYGGNIVSTMAQLAISDAKKIILFHRSKEHYPEKIKSTFQELINYIIRTKEDSALINSVKEILFDNLGNIAESLDELKDYIQISNDLSELKSCDLIFTGTNSTRPIINRNLIKKNTTIIDLAVPGDVSDECYQDQSIRVIKGGIARFPQQAGDIRIEIPSFPLATNESFACMAETFSLGLSPIKGHLNIGPIAIDDIQEISKVAKEVGFTLFNTKKTNSL